MGIHQHLESADDFSRDGANASQCVVELVEQFAVQFTLLYVVENFPQDRSNEFIAPEHIDPARYREDQACLEMTKIAERRQCQDANQQVPFSMKLRSHATVRYAEVKYSDLVIIGSHHIHGISPFWARQPVAMVNRAACEVLEVRAKTS